MHTVLSQKKKFKKKIRDISPNKEAKQARLGHLWVVKEERLRLFFFCKKRKTTSILTGLHSDFAMRPVGSYAVFQNLGKMEIFKMVCLGSCKMQNSELIL